MLTMHNMQTISIGKPIAILSENPEADARYYAKSGYAIAYKGKCINLSPLLSALDLVVALIYELNDRHMFIMTVIELMRKMPISRSAQKQRISLKKLYCTTKIIMMMNYMTEPSIKYNSQKELIKWQKDKNILKY